MHYCLHLRPFKATPRDVCMKARIQVHSVHLSMHDHLVGGGKRGGRGGQIKSAVDGKLPTCK
jgi:hypothetical protein